MSARWKIDQTSLPFCTENYEENPEDTESEEEAWSAFCARLKYSLPIEEKIEVSTVNLTREQRMQAVHAIRLRGWCVVLHMNSIEIARPR